MKSLGIHEDQEGKGNGEGQQEYPHKRSSWRRGESEDKAGGGCDQEEGRSGAQRAESQEGPLDKLREEPSGTSSVKN